MAKYKKEIMTGIMLIIVISLISKTAFDYNSKMNEIKKIESKKELKWQGIDTWAFGDAFNYMQLTYGKVLIFEWRDNKYKAILKEGK